MTKNRVYVTSYEPALVTVSGVELAPANTIEGNLTGPLPDEPRRRLAGAAAAPIR